MDCQENTGFSELKKRGVIMLTDNRNSSNEKPIQDYRCSGFKETEVDPFQEIRHDLQLQSHEDLLDEINKRLTVLEQKVKTLQTNTDIIHFEASAENDMKCKKKRRKFKQLERNLKCDKCLKNYGSSTSLKLHMKLKHDSKQQNLNQLEVNQCD